MKLVDALRGFALGTGLLACAFAHAGTEDDIDQLMSRYQGQVPGASVLVIHDGQPVFRRSYGLANLEDKVGVMKPRIEYLQYLLGERRETVNMHKPTIQAMWVSAAVLALVLLAVIFSFVT